MIKLFIGKSQKLFQNRIFSKHLTRKNKDSITTTLENGLALSAKVEQTHNI